MKGGDTTKPQFTQHWKHSESLARHAWRCYLKRPDVTVDAMSKPSYHAWAACNAVWDRLKPSEQEIVKAFHAIRASPDDPGKMEYQVSRLAAEKHVTSDYVWQTVRKAWKMWAIERGLADE